MVGERMDKHITILAVLHLIFGGLFILAGILAFVTIAGAGAISGDRDAVFVTGTVGTIIAIFFLILGLPGILAGIGLFQHAPWARIIAIILGILNLFNVPIGTALGIYTLWVLFQPDAQRMFSPDRSQMQTST